MSSQTNVFGWKVDKGWTEHLMVLKSDPVKRLTCQTMSYSVSYKQYNISASQCLQSHSCVQLLITAGVLKLLPWKISNRRAAASPSEWTPHSWRCRLTWRLPPWRAHPLDKADSETALSVTSTRRAARKLIFLPRLFRTPRLQSPSCSLPVGVSDFLTTTPSKWSAGDNHNPCAEPGWAYSWSYR